MLSLDTQKLAQAIIKKRSKTGKGLRPISTDIGIKHNTLARMENGRLSDVTSLIRVLSWLKTSLTKFTKED